jgi:hypothetical protein
VRLGFGNAEDLAGAVAQRRFSPALYDCLDKIRIELGDANGQGSA